MIQVSEDDFDDGKKTVEEVLEGRGFSRNRAAQMDINDLLK